MTTVFKSKRDAWIVVVIWAGALLSAAGGLAQLSSDAPLPLRLGLLLLLIAAAAFMLWTLYSTSYALADKQLLIRCGPFKFQVPLAEIDLVEPSRNPLSSPACSLDRLLIRWRGERKRVLISPSRKMDFLRELKKRCAQLEQQGDRLVRTSQRT